MDLTTTNQPGAVSDISQLEGLAAQARVYSENLAMNMFQLGRVYTEAKKLVRHGEWAGWLRDNSGMSERSAQQLMAVYARFGEQSRFMNLEKSKLFKMLSLPSGQEEAFIADNDLENMTSREVEAAVKKVRAEMQTQLEAERNTRMDAVERARTMQKQLLEIQSDELPDEVANTLRRQEATIRQQQAMLEAAQETINESSRKLVDQERRSAREDAEPEESLDEAMRAAISAFLSSPAGTAAEDSRRVMQLDPVERLDMNRLVDMLESWCQRMRNRLNEFSTEGVIS